MNAKNANNIQNTEDRRSLHFAIKTLEATTTIGHVNLTLVPLSGPRAGRLDYILSAEAIEAGVLTITEVSEDGSVPELLAENEGSQLVLLLDGEELVGAKQNRIMNTSVLLRPDSRTKIPVSCVEQGRWRRTSREFASGGYSPSFLRQRKSKSVSYQLRATGEAQSDQGEVWDSVEESMASLCASSPTMAMSDAVRQRAQAFEPYVNALGYPQGARGVIAAVNGKFAAADVFDSPETLERIWSRLITGYAMDAVALKSTEKPKTARSLTAHGARMLLEHVGEIGCDVCPSVGLGKDWRFEAKDVVGQGLVARKACVHLSIFPNDDSNQDDRRPSRIVPPSRRRRGRSS
jgi:hypothetical protein